MDPHGVGAGGLTATEPTCTSCGTHLPPESRFCNQCGAQVTQSTRSAEYKQVTVLFADVVHSMDIAKAVGAERLREMMAGLLDRATAVVGRYGGTVDKFTGDGIMAVFGAPIALEDHALRACRAALDIHSAISDLAGEVSSRDGVQLQVRIGLNSGQVIAGEIGSGGAVYTAIGEQVGLAQRMESVAPPGGVMLSESTARLVEQVLSLGGPEMVRIKGAAEPVAARRLIGLSEDRGTRPTESALVGRAWELSTVTGIFGEAVNGAGCVVGIAGPAGIGKSRLVRETVAVAASRGVDAFITHCESHTSDIPLHALAGLLRSGLGVGDLGDGAARSRLRDLLPTADPDDLVLLDDLLGIAAAGVGASEVAADARRRRLTALINSAALERAEPVLYVIEDAHWIDPASESVLADFLSVIPQTPALVLITYRPEYRGVLSRVPGAPLIALRPLSDAHASALAAELLGSDPSVAAVAAQVAGRAAGNPFFVEEMVRDLSERGVVRGEPGSYQLQGDVADVEVPPTLQAVIGARIDRLAAGAKHTLHAAAVIGSRFDADLLASLADGADVAPLMQADLVDQVRFTPPPEYAFRHPLIRTVAYESQLKSDRAQLHGRLAAAIQASGSADQKAAVIAQHLEAAGAVHDAFAWHMRAGTWSTNRDIAAARTSWRRARRLADRLPDNDERRLPMRIAPRALLCGTVFRVSTSGGDDSAADFDELHELCTAAGDQRSLAIGMAGRLMKLFFTSCFREASQLATEHVRLLETIGDPTLTAALGSGAAAAKQYTGEMTEVLRLAQLTIDAAESDSTGGALVFAAPVRSALAMRGIARSALGIPGWREDLQTARVAAASDLDAFSAAGVGWYTQVVSASFGYLLPDAAALCDTEETWRQAQQSGDDLALALATAEHGVVLVHATGPLRDAGLPLLLEARDAAVRAGIPSVVQDINIFIAREAIRGGDTAVGIDSARSVLDELIGAGDRLWTHLGTAVLVDGLLARGTAADLDEARIVIERLAAMPAEPGFVLNKIALLRMRALLARAQGDEDGYRDYRDRYRKMAADLGFEVHMKWAEEMP